MRALELLFFSVCLLLSLSQLPAQQPVDQIKSLYENNNRDSALILIEKFEPIYHSGNQWDSLVQVLRLKAVIYSTIKPLPEALEAFSEAEAVAEQYLPSTNREYIMVKLNKGDCLSRMTRYAEAEDYFDEVLELAQQAGDTTGLRVRVLSLISWQYVMQYKYRNALEMVRKANREFFVAGNLDSMLLVGNYGAMSQLFHDLGMPDSTLFYGQKWLDLTKNLYPPDHNNIGFAYTSMAGYYYDLREMNLALDYLARAGHIFFQDYQKYGNSRYLAVSLAHRGLMYFELREYALATDFYQRAIEFLQQEYGSESVFLVEYYLKMAEIFMQKGQLEDAKSWLDKASGIAGAHPAEVEMINTVKSSLVRFHRLNGEMDLSDQLVHELYTFRRSEDGLFSNDGLNSTQAVAQNYLVRGDHTLSLQWFEQALAISDSIYFRSHPLSVQIMVDIMRVLLDTKEYSRVEEVSLDILQRRVLTNSELNIKHCIPTFELLEYSALWAEYLEIRIQDGVTDPASYLKFVLDFEIYYNQHLSILRSNDAISDKASLMRRIYDPLIVMLAKVDPFQALMYSEKVKSFVTRILIQNQLVHQQAGSISMTRKLSSLLSQSMEENDPEVLSEISDMMEQLNKYKDSLYKSDPALYNKAFGFQDVDTTEILVGLDADEMLIEYTFVDSQLYIFGYDGYHTHMHAVSKNAVLTLLERIYENYDPRLLHQLYKDLMPPFTRGFEKFLIVPDEFLYHFNFEQLVDESGRYLIHTKRFRYAYSAAIAAAQHKLNRQKKNPNNIVAFTPGFLDTIKTDYLRHFAHLPIDSAWLNYLQQPFLLDLAERLDRVKNSRSYRLHEANERMFKSQSENYQIIHLGTHGEIDDASPLFSRLIFAKDTLEDGYLHTYEIFGLDLDANLAILSACETGSGAYSSGEGVISMAHAFTHAGCPSVLMSLWKIDEKSSAGILKYFYKYLLRGQSKSEALRMAKLDFLATAPVEMRDPYYWAGLVIMGDDSPLRLAGMQTIGWMGVGALVLLLCVLGGKYWWGRRRG